MIQRILISLLTVLVLASPAAAVEWKIDNTHSTVAFKVRHFFARQAGQFAKFDGVIHYDPAQPTSARVEANIDAASIDTEHEGRDEHLRSADFFDVEKHPSISFKSNKVEVDGEQLMVFGDLTIKGISKPVSFPIEFLGAGPDPWGNQRAGFSASLKLKRKDFDITWNNTLDTGGTVLGEDVTISLEIEAVSEMPGTESR